MGPLARLGVGFRRGFGRVTPDPFVLAVALSIAVLLVAVGFGEWPSPDGEAEPAGLLGAAGTPGIAGLARRASGPRTLVAITAAVSIALAVLHGSALGSGPSTAKWLSVTTRRSPLSRERPPASPI